MKNEDIIKELKANSSNRNLKIIKNKIIIYNHKNFIETKIELLKILNNNSIHYEEKFFYKKYTSIITIAALCLIVIGAGGYYSTDQMVYSLFFMAVMLSGWALLYLSFVNINKEEILINGDQVKQLKEILNR